MMESGLPDIGDMIKQISENPTAREMLASLISNNSETPENIGSSSPNDDAPESVTASVHTSHRHPRGGERRALLRALKPYLGTRRAATLCRMERALDIYDLIEQMIHTKGGS